MVVYTRPWYYAIFVITEVLDCKIWYYNFDKQLIVALKHAHAVCCLVISKMQQVFLMLAYRVDLVHNTNLIHFDIFFKYFATY